MTHPHTPHASFDGGDLDCGNGLLLLIRKNIDPLEPGQFLEIISYDSTVEVDLPSWCNMTKNDLVNVVSEYDEQDRKRWRFLVSKGPYTVPVEQQEPDSSLTIGSPVTEEIQILAGPELKPKKKQRKKAQMPITQEVVEPYIPTSFPEPVEVDPLEALSTIPLGSWPRPRWLLQDLHLHLEGRLSDEEFQATADDAVRLAISAQERAGMDVVSDGEMRRDNYSSFVAGLLQNSQLIPITDLLPYVDDPVEFEQELRALDVPAGEVRHPAVFGKLGRNTPIAAHEVDFARSITDKPIKVSLPGPYLLTRTMWMECVSDRAYNDREELAQDIVRILREEIHHLLASGAAMIQLDEPVLSEVVYGADGGTTSGRTFMCGALDAVGGSIEEELGFARELLHEVTKGFPAHRLALHVCRGNWTPDESAALSGDYSPFVPLFSSLNVQNLVLELATPRAGELTALAGIREDQRVGVGVVNQKNPEIEEVDIVAQRIRTAIDTFGRDRVLLNTDCGFATFADNPIQSAAIAEKQLELIIQARDMVCG